MGMLGVMIYCYTTPMNFHGVKIAVLVEGKLLMHLRDNKPGLFNANMWDFPGGGREGDETPEACAVREIFEEFEITLETSSIVWKKDFAAQKDPNQRAFFLVATIPLDDTKKIILHEGQKWVLMSQEDFFAKDDVISALKERFRNYLESNV